jgi:hypothetical protein
LLSAKGSWDKLKSLYKQFSWRFVSSAQQIAPRSRSFFLLYTIFIHPFYLIVRTASRLVRSKSWNFSFKLRL